jgi:hypothetical protein
MADSKITALTALTAADPVNDVFPIVDVSDTTMAASGTTKKISVNNILSSSPTASGALTVTGLVTAGSATITGALTVGNGTSATQTFSGVTNILDIGYGSLRGGSAYGDVRLWTDRFRIYNNAGTQIIKNISGTNGDETWYDGAGGTRMTLNSTGLGVGVTPSAWASGFKVVQFGPGSAISCNTNASRCDVSANYFYDGANKFITASGYATNLTQENGNFYFYRSTATSGGAGAALTFTQAMTLDASGNLLVGTASVLNGARVSVKTASVTSALSLNGVTGDTAQESLVINKFDSNSTTSQVFARFTNNNGSAGSGQINGNGANACAFGSFSDARLKENIVSLTSQLANILSLRPVEFDYKDGSGHQIGFVAQEIQEVYSDTVAEQNGFLTVTGWSKTEARLVSAIQELTARVQTLEAR